MYKAIIRLTSVTYAIRAQKLLEQHGIRSTIKKITKSLHMGGCGYGLELASGEVDTARVIITSAGIRILEIAV